MPSKAKTQSSITIDGDRKNLSAELARSRIYQAVTDHLRELGVRPGGEPGAWDWSLDFTLHFGLEPPPDQFAGQVREE